MKIVAAIDSFKGSMSSIEAGEAAAQGIRRVNPEIQVVVRPLADGGEGTVEALVSGMEGKYEQVRVTGPLGAPVDCRYGIIPVTQTAVIEMSGAAGITLVPKEALNPLLATTYGVGEVIRDAVGKGCRHFIIGIGGSATNDGGVGMLQALGWRFQNAEGEEIPRGAAGLRQLDHIEDSNVLPELSACTFRIACDVSNPLCGPTGCSAVYGPQKGATPTMVSEMDRRLAHYAAVAMKHKPGVFTATEENEQKSDPGDRPSRGLHHTEGSDSSDSSEPFGPDTPGAGAAGGMGFAFLTFLHGKLEPGIRIVEEETHLEDEIRDADLVITGEGRLDAQSAMGKAPVGVAALAKKYGMPVVALAGSVTSEARACNQKGIDAFFPIVRGAVSLADAMNPENARQNMADTAEQAVRLFLVHGTRGGCC